MINQTVKAAATVVQHFDAGMISALEAINTLRSIRIDAESNGSMNNNAIQALITARNHINGIGAATRPVTPARTTPSIADYCHLLVNPALNQTGSMKRHLMAFKADADALCNEMRYTLLTIEQLEFILTTAQEVNA